MTVPFLTVKPKSIKLKVSPRFPAQVVGRTGIDVNKANGNYYFDLDYAAFPQLSTPTPGTYVAQFNPTSGQFTTVPISSIAFQSTNVKNFGAVGDGVTDDTAAIQAALNSGATAVYVPQGIYKFTTLTIPATSGFTFYGEKTASVLKQTGIGIVFPSNATPVYSEGYIADLSFDGTSGTGHTIDTTSVGGLTLSNLYFHNVPSGKSSIYVNGTASTSVHDIRLLNIEIYSTGSGHSGIRFGPKCQDSSLTAMIMNGNFNVTYCIYFDVGAGAVKISDSHPYNSAGQVVYLAGNNYIQFTNCTIDRPASGFDNVYSTGGGQLTFDNCFFEAIPVGQSGLTLNNNTSARLTGSIWSAQGSGATAVTESGVTNNTTILGGEFDVASNFATTPFTLVGSSSIAKFVNIAGYSPLGINFGFSGATTVAQAQGTTQFLGVNGGQATSGITAYVVPYTGTVQSSYIASTNTPAAGQTFTFNVIKNGSTIGVTGTISNGSFSTTITGINTSVVLGDQIAIQSVFSATSGSSNVRWSVMMSG